MNEKVDHGSTEDEARCVTRCPGETVSLGKRLGKLLKPGDVVCLFGELGAGKTCLAGGLVEGMGAGKAAVASPSFIMVNQYMGRFPVYHMDLYRLDSRVDVEDIGFRDYLSGDGVTLIEWASRIERELPSDRLDMVLAHISATEREIKLTIKGRNYEDRVQEMFAALRGAV